MSGSKYFERVAWSITALVLAVTILFMNGNWIGIAAMERTMGYESRLFDATKVHSIDIVMDDWDTFIANATIGFNLPWNIAYPIGAVCVVAYVGLICWYGRKRASRLKAV